MRDIERRAIGAAVRRWRLRAGLTQAQAAALAGVGQPYIARMERGQRPATLEILLRLRVDVGALVAELHTRAGWELEIAMSALSIQPIYTPAAWRWLLDALGTSYAWAEGDLHTPWPPPPVDCGGFVCAAFREAERRGLVTVRTTVPDVGARGWADFSVPVTEAEVRAGDLTFYGIHVRMVLDVVTLPDGRRRVLTVGAEGLGSRTTLAAPRLADFVRVTEARDRGDFTCFMRPRAVTVTYADGRNAQTGDLLERAAPAADGAA